MHQESLFDTEKGDTDNTAPPSPSIYSARVGAIRFGATERSFALTRDALIDLTAPAAEEDEEPS